MPKKKSSQKRNSRADETSASVVEATTASATGFPVVGIGSSAGGLEALKELLENMPADSGMAFVVVTHQHPGHATLLPELLGKISTMQVVEATDGLRLQPNQVYIGLPGGKLALMGGVLQRVDSEQMQAPHLPIDYFFRSLAEDQHERAICVVLSGTGTDGTLGLKAIKAESGMIMAQLPGSAKYAGMPASAISTGLVDFVLPPAEMPRQLIAYAQGPYLAGHRSSDDYPRMPDKPIRNILLLLRSRTGNDFSSYKDNTIRRRIERRMNVHQIEKPELYVSYLQENPHELDILFRELLISVTNFFRDAEAWAILADHIETLLDSRPENYTLRAWVPGSATGEEAYSLAILLSECMDRLKRYCEVQIFATDLDGDAIEKARAGVYPDGIAVDVSPPRLERYFTHDEGRFRIRKEIRDMIVFAPQNAIKDPPFTKLDIVSCRNLLIYLNSDLQRKLLPIFHYTLKPGGLLFLGPSESIGNFGDLFESLDKRWKIFRRKENAAVARLLPSIPAQPPAVDDAALMQMASVTISSKEMRLAKPIERLLLDRFAPVSIVVNDQGDILFIHGRTGEYLEPTEGEPRNNLLEMAREGLQIELSSAMRECAAKNAAISRKAIRVRTSGDYHDVDLTVSRINEPETLRGLLLVTFSPTTLPVLSPPEGSKRPPRKSGDDEYISKLERELQYLRESRETAREELETSNEELKSTNEELQSTNEELQSTNEELETSKEELQSLNEELSTVNAELQSKVDDLSQVNDDMLNLLESTDIATVFLDRELNVKRFTEQARNLVMLRQTDVGRPISELASNFDAGKLVGDCRQVLKTLAFKEAEVTTRDGGYYLMRIMPYRTSENVIDGLVLTFVNIERVKAGETARDYFESIFDTVREPLLVLDEGFRVVSANRAYYHSFHTSAAETEHESIFKLGGGQWDIKGLRKLLEEILPENNEFRGYEVDIELAGIGRRRFLLNARRLHQTRGQAGRILLAIEGLKPTLVNAGEAGGE